MLTELLLVLIKVNQKFAYAKKRLIFAIRRFCFTLEIIIKKYIEGKKCQK